MGSRSFTRQLNRSTILAIKPFVYARNKSEDGDQLDDAPRDFAAAVFSVAPDRDRVS
jgi:hypothetical protein